MVKFDKTFSAPRSFAFENKSKPELPENAPVNPSDLPLCSNDSKIIIADTINNKISFILNTHLISSSYYILTKFLDKYNLYPKSNHQRSYIKSKRSRGWHFNSVQIEFNVENRMDFTCPFFNFDKLTLEIPVLSDNSFKVILRSAITLSRHTIIIKQPLKYILAYNASIFHTFNDNH